MWRLSPQEKIQQYLLLNNLEISGIIHEDHDSPVIVLKRSIKDNAMTPFRAGDTMVLYPDERDGRGMLRHLVHKCTIIEIGYNEVKVRLKEDSLKMKQPDKGAGVLKEIWKGLFMYQFLPELFEFASAPAIYRSKILGIEAPRGSHEPKINEESIDELVLRAAGSPDYFLLWGPPGSGKTSVLTKLINAIINTDEEGILLLAYTNRAVDEICDVIERLATVADYIRIGSRVARSRPDFHHRLYDQIASNFTTRSLLIQEIQSTRIFTGTLTSIHGKPELFSLKKFSTIIIDEASQILESGLIGLLSRFNGFILIGDHLNFLL
ncbi:MAG: AAA domain-containing protein [Saprospiraceae bacterium]